jgi:hypothetical protein
MCQEQQQQGLHLAHTLHRAPQLPEIRAAIVAHLDNASLFAVIRTCRCWFATGVRFLWYTPPTKALRSVDALDDVSGHDDVGRRHGHQRKLYGEAIRVLHLELADKKAVEQLWPFPKINEVHIDGRLARNVLWLADLLSRCGPSLATFAVTRNYPLWEEVDDGDAKAEHGAGAAGAGACGGSNDFWAGRLSFPSAHVDRRKKQRARFARDEGLLLQLAARRGLRSFSYAELKLEHGASLRRLRAAVVLPFAALEKLHIATDHATTTMLLALLLDSPAHASLTRLHVSLALDDITDKDAESLFGTFARFDALTALDAALHRLPPRFSATHMRPLRQLAQLRKLSLATYRLPPCGLAVPDAEWRALLRSWPRLEMLDIDFCLELAPDALLELGDSCPELRLVNLPKSCCLEDVYAAATQRTTATETLTSRSITPLYPKLEHLVLKRAGNADQPER